jgi:hypothetical protein
VESLARFRSWPIAAAFSATIGGMLSRTPGVAGSGADVEDPRARRAFERPARRGCRVVRTVLGVCGGRGTERRAQG